MDERKAFINAIGTAVPDHDVHDAFIAWAAQRLDDPRERSVFGRMAGRSGIEHRWSVLPPTKSGGSPVEEGGFYAEPTLPSTAKRMDLYAAEAPRLAVAAIARLAAKTPIAGVTHLVVASCTGFVAPGVDQIIAAELGLDGGVERTLVGFMGCYAAVAALRVAYHIVRSEPSARVLVVTVELSTLHLQNERRAHRLLAMLQFGDGAAAALVTAEPVGFAISGLFSTTLQDSGDLIRWTIGDEGFAMDLSGQVPAAIAQAFGDDHVRGVLSAGSEREPNAWAVHAGGRSILDAVETGLGLAPDALAESRDTLRRFGNMSSSTLMFVLDELLSQRPRQTEGVAIAFGPGLAAEGFHFRSPE